MCTAPLTRCRWLAFERERPHLLPSHPHPSFLLEATVSRVVARDWLVSFRGNRYSVPFRLIGKAVEVQARDGTVRIFHRGDSVAEHPERLGGHALTIAPEHGPGAVVRHARSRFADGPRRRPDPLMLEVEVRDLARYDRLADVAATGEAGFANTYLVTERLEQNESPSEPVLGLPADFSENLALPVNFTWMRAADAERDRVTYRHCVWSADTVFDYNKCSVVAEPFASRDSLVYGGIALLLALLLLFILFRTLLKNRLIALALVAVLLLLAVVIVFWSGRREALDEMVADLESGRIYFWKVIAEDEEGAMAESATRRLTVR